MKDTKPNQKLFTVKPDSESHITIKESELCQLECEDKPCTYYCPTQVFNWNNTEQIIEIDYERCIECLACPQGCPYNNILWHYPPGDYGVDYTANNQQT